MKTITAIEAQKKNPNRVNICLDGEFAFGLSRLSAAWLRVGQTLSPEKIASLQEADAREWVMQKALFFLGFRARSEREMRDYLLKQSAPPALLEETLARLKENHLLNDEDFARNWVENRSVFRPRGRRALQMELRRKGLSENDIAAALPGPEQETSLALEAARRYAQKTRGLAAQPWAEFRVKVGGFLTRRGFSYQQAAEACRQVWNEVSHHTGNEDVTDEYLD